MQKLDWGTSPPTQLVDKWNTFISEFPTLAQVTLSRHIDIRCTGVANRFFRRLSEGIRGKCVFTCG